MKKAIDPQGNEVEVADDVVVRTSKGGIYYLLTLEEKIKYDDALISDQERITKENKIAHNAEIDKKLEEQDIKVIRALVEGDAVRIQDHKLAQSALRATRHNLEE